MITYRNGRILCTIKDKITSKKKKITLSVALIFVTLFGMSKDAQPMRVPSRLPSAAEIHRPAPQYSHQYAPTFCIRDFIRFSLHRVVTL